MCGEKGEIIIILSLHLSLNWGSKGHMNQRLIHLNPTSTTLLWESQDQESHTGTDVNTVILF